MAYNTPTAYGTNDNVASRTISPSDGGATAHSNYSSPRIYKGFSSNNPNAVNSMLYDADLIKQDIYNHFMTAKGERIMLPNFGSIIWDYLYEPLDTETKSVIEADARDVIGQDPRVQLLKLDVVGFEHGIVLNVRLNILPQNRLAEMNIQFNKTGNI
jgi:phage baseplate assembly protein W